MVKDNPVELIHNIQEIFDNTDDGRVLFNEILGRRNDNLTELQRGVDFFILNRITFSGVVDSGGYSNTSFHHRFTQTSIDRITEISTLFRRIEITNNDYSVLLNQPGRNVFIFLDPPYYYSTKSKLYGRNGILHQQFNHQELFNQLENINHRWLMTYDNSEYIRNLYQDYYTIQWEFQYGMNNYGRDYSPMGSELLISNYNIEEMM